MFRFLRIIGAGSSPPRPENLSDTSSDKESHNYDYPSPQFINDHKLPKLKRSLSDNDLHVFDKEAHNLVKKCISYPNLSNLSDHIVRKVRYCESEFGGQTFKSDSPALEGLCGCDKVPLQIPHKEFWVNRETFEISSSSSTSSYSPRARTEDHSNNSLNECLFSESPIEPSIRMTNEDQIQVAPATSAEMSQAQDVVTVSSPVHIPGSSVTTTTHSVQINTGPIPSTSTTAAPTPAVSPPTIDYSQARHPPPPPQMHQPAHTRAPAHHREGGSKPVKEENIPKFEGIKLTKPKIKQYLKDIHTFQIDNKLSDRETIDHLRKGLSKKAFEWYLDLDNNRPEVLLSIDAFVRDFKLTFLVEESPADIISELKALSQHEGEDASQFHMRCGNVVASCMEWQTNLIEGIVNTCLGEFHPQAETYRQYYVSELKAKLTHDHWLHGLRYNIGPQIRQAVHIFNPRKDIHQIRRTATRIEKDFEAAQEKAAKVFGLSLPTTAASNQHDFTEDSHSTPSHQDADYQDPNAGAQVAAFTQRGGKFGGRGRGRGRGRGGQHGYNNSTNFANNTAPSEQSSSSNSKKKFKGRRGQLVQMPDGSVKQLKNGDCFKCGQTGHVDAPNCKNDYAPTAILDKPINVNSHQNINAMATPDGQSQLERDIGALHTVFNPRGVDRSLDMCPSYRPGYQNF